MEYWVGRAVNNREVCKRIAGVLDAGLCVVIGVCMEDRHAKKSGGGAKEGEYVAEQETQTGDCAIEEVAGAWLAGCKGFQAMAKAICGHRLSFLEWF
jgi:D-Tyr-tRNAtyr deacylase